MRLGIDTSTYLEMDEVHHAKYFDGDREIEPLEAFHEKGVDVMRIRIWNNPYGENGEPYLAGTCDVANFIRLAALAQQKGYRIMADFHYSDFWADPAKQCIPKAWRGLDLDGLVEKVYAFTAETLKTAKENGIDIEFIQVGNEITNGILWPYGHLDDLPDGSRTNYDSLIRLLNAGIKACREIYPQAGIILHLERSYDQGVYNEFYGRMQEADVDYDIIGMSYYSYWHGPFSQFFANVENCKKFGKRIMVVELGRAFTSEDYIKSEDSEALMVNNGTHEDENFNKRYPLTEIGQCNFIKDFLRLSEEYGVELVCYWEPLWTPFGENCWASDAGKEYIGSDKKSNRNEYANHCLFDYHGRKLPAFDMYKKK